MFDNLSSFPSFSNLSSTVSPFFRHIFLDKKITFCWNTYRFFDWLTAVWHSQIVPVTMNVEFFCVTLIWGCCGPVLGPFLRLPLKSLVSIILLQSYLFIIFFGYCVGSIYILTYMRDQTESTTILGVVLSGIIVPCTQCDNQKIRVLYYMTNPSIFPRKYVF